MILTTDGSSGSGAGGWAYVLRDGEQVTEGSGYVRDMPKVNVMELVAVREGLRAVPRDDEDIQVVTDSVNVIGWLYGWNVVTKKPDPAKRFKRDSWEVINVLADIEELVEARRLRLHFVHVRGHTGHEDNERCDKLAVAARKEVVDKSRAARRRVRLDKRPSP